ncbi:MAG TPA: type II toxin-antitoxin system RelE/ParE family toxin [Chitinophagaceae bacterium]|nr:type II toxin-antitoxin system RelE/ParE family toxin [Chitinophagaceae bacterium]
MEQLREIVFFGDYFEKFYALQTFKVKEKIDYVFFFITHAERIPAKFLKHMEGEKGLYEIRVDAGGNIFRIFCCLDRDRIIVLFNGFQKMTPKTPKMEIQLATRLMKEYYATK